MGEGLRPSAEDFGIKPESQESVEEKAEKKKKKEKFILLALILLFIRRIRKKISLFFRKLRGY